MIIKSTGNRPHTTEFVRLCPLGVSAAQGADQPVRVALGGTGVPALIGHRACLAVSMIVIARCD
jgi:hypothetical protein